MSRPDPEKAVYLKPGQHSPRGKKREQARGRKEQWEEHRGDCALDPWGTAIRDMRRAGTWPEEV